MVILTDKEIKAKIKQGDLVIDPPPKEIQPASIDLTVGEEAFIATADDITRVDQKRLLVIPAGELALMITREKVKLSQKIVGRIGLRSHYTRKGLILLAGPQIDPGFEGYLHVCVCNLSPTEISMAYGDPFCTVEFHALSEPVEKPYSGEYQLQHHITSDDIRDIKERRGYALSEIIMNMQVIARDISSLRNIVETLRNIVETYSKRVDTYMGIFVASLVALVIGILVQLFI